MIPRYTGFDPDGVAETEADHFGNCPVCGADQHHERLAYVLGHSANMRPGPPVF
jgi:hypothetical protein